MEPQFLELNDAIKLCEELGVHKTKETLVNWAKKYGLGHQLGGNRYGSWLFDKTKLEAFIKGGSHG